MTKTAKGSFQVADWDEKTYEKLGGKAKLTRARIGQDFSGDIEAKAGWELLMCYRKDGTAEYTGLGRFEGRVAGRLGSFVVRSDGSFDGSEAKSSFAVVVGSGTGKLSGIRGRGTSVAPHGPSGTYSFKFDLD